MKDDAEILTPETAIPSPTEPPSNPEPVFLSRARRILDGDMRPEDYLEVTPEVARRVKRDMDFALARSEGQQLAPEVGPRQTRQETLSFHHAGQNIAYIEDDRGVIVLAVGLDQLKVILDTFLNRTTRTIAIDCPFPLDDAGAYAANYLSGSVQLEVL